MKPSKLLPLALLCFAIFGYLSCKKTDPGQVQPSQPTDRFFSVSSDAAKEIRAITRSLQKQNDKYHYLSSITKKAGYPKWDKARIVNFDNKMVTGKGSDAESGEIVYIPFVRDSDNYVNALLAVKMDASDTVYRMLHDYNYRKFGYDTTGPSKWSARDVFNLFVSFDNSVFGHRKFIIEDGKLFGIDTASGFIAELISGINKSTARVSLMEPVEICETYTVCPSCDAYVRAMKENVLPGSAPCCDPFDVTFCTTYWADVIGGGGGGDGSGDTGGWTGTGDGTGGTSGGGGGTGWYGGSDPCAGSTTPIPRLSTVAPVDGCGSGWTPVQPTEIIADPIVLGEFYDDPTYFEDDNMPISFDVTQQQWPTIANVLSANDFVEYDHRNCLDLAKAQIAKASLRDLGYGSAFKTYTESGGVNQSQTKDGIDYIISKLQAGKPVIVGVDNRPGTPSSLNADGSTDHFIVITGSGADANGNYFTFFDNATNWVSHGASSNNKLYYNPTTGQIKGHSDVPGMNGPSPNHNYIVTQVRKNK